jgi:hypothetical protein
MNSIQKIDTNNITALTPGERINLLREHLGASVESMRAAAEIFAVMESNGDDISAIPRHLVRILRRISAQTLLPEVAVRLEGRVRQKVELLPLAEQKRLSEPGATISLLPAPDAAPVEVEVQRLDPQQTRQVFGAGLIRTPEEQRLWLMRQTPGPAPAPAGGDAGTGGHPEMAGVVIDAQRKIAIIEGRIFSRHDLKRIVGALGARRNALDWEQIEAEYRAGERLLEIAGRREMTHGQLATLITRRRKAGKWNEPKRKAWVKSSMTVGTGGEGNAP